jgi:hypothetical protein
VHIILLIIYVCTLARVIYVNIKGCVCVVLRKKSKYSLPEFLDLSTEFSVYIYTIILPAMNLPIGSRIEMLRQ